MSQKGLAPILIVLIIAALVGGYLIYQNQPKPTPPSQPTTQPSPTPTTKPVPNGAAETANWKTYKNSNLGLEFKYPPNSVSFQEENVDENHRFDRIELSFDKNSCNSHYCEGIYIDIDKIRRDVDIVDTLEQALKAGYAGMGGPYLSEKTDSLTVGGVRALSQFTEFDSESKTYDVAILKGDFFYKFTLFSKNINISKYKSILDSLLSTVKFIKITQPLDQQTKNSAIPIPSGNTLTLSGQVYRDDNCNMRKDINESGVANVEVSIVKKPEYNSLAILKTDANGMYKFTKTISKNESITIQPIATSLPGYQANPVFRPDFGTTVFSSSKLNATVDLDQLPTEGIKNCK